MPIKQSGGLLEYIPWTLKRNTACGAQNQTIGTGGAYRRKQYLKTSGMPTAGFTRLIREGRLIPYTQFTQYEQNGEALTASFDVQMSGYPGTCGKTREWYPGTAPYHNAFGPSEVECATEAGKFDARSLVQTAAAQIYTKGWDSLTFAGELKQTIRMFRNAARRFVTLASKRKLDSTDRLENLWLEGRYGWRTLRYDLEDLDGAISNFNETRQRYTRSINQLLNWNTTTTSVDSTSWVSGVVTTVRTRNYSLGLRGSVAADIRPPRFAINPFTTAWELTKLSFVVDWLYDIGTALEAISFLAIVDSYTACTGLLLEVDEQYTNTAVAKSGYVINSYGFTCTSNVKYTLRLPTTVSITPQIKVNLDAYKLIDLAALVRQAYLRRR